MTSIYNKPFTDRGPMLSWPTGGILAIDEIGSIRDMLVEAGVAEVLISFLAKEGGRADGSIPLVSE